MNNDILLFWSNFWNLSFCTYLLSKAGNWDSFARDSNPRNKRENDLSAVSAFHIHVDTIAIVLEWKKKIKIVRLFSNSRKKKRKNLPLIIQILGTKDIRQEKCHNFSRICKTISKITRHNVNPLKTRTFIKMWWKRDVQFYSSLKKERKKEKKFQIRARQFLKKFNFRNEERREKRILPLLCFVFRGPLHTNSRSTS